MEADGRQRPIGLPSLVALGINGVVGVGIFFAPASVAAQIPGPAGVLAYLGTALALLPIAFGYAALGRRFHVDGGPYVWASAAFGPRVAFGVGWVSYVSSLLSVAAVISGLAHHAAPLLGIVSEPAVRALGVAAVVVLGALAATGLRPSSMVWTTVTVLKLVPLVALIVLGLAHFGAVSGSPPAAEHAPSLHEVERAVLVVVFACQGFEIVPLLAGSVRRADRAVPVATLVALVFSASLYALLHGLAVHAVPDLGRSPMPLVAAAERYGGRGASAVVAAGANVSAFGIAFGMLNTTPRYLSALSSPSAFGGWVGEVDGRFVPQRALWVTVAVAAVLLGAANTITQLFVLSSLAVLLQYTVVLASLTRLSLKREHGLTPLRLWPVPLSLAAIVLVAQGAEWREFFTAAAVVAAGEVLRRVGRARA